MAQHRLIMKLLTVKGIAEKLVVSQSTIYQWVAEEIIPFHKLNGVIRFNADDINHWMAENRKGYTTLTGRRPKKGGKI